MLAYTQYSIKYYLSPYKLKYGMMLKVLSGSHKKKFNPNLFINKIKKNYQPFSKKEQIKIYNAKTINT